MLRTAFKLPPRQTEGLLASVLTLMDLTISAPDHTTVSRRAVTLPVIQPASVPQGPLHVLIDSTGLQVYGAGQWLEAKHGGKPRRKWRKLHLAVDAACGMIVAQRDWLEFGGHAAIAARGYGSLAGWNFCPKPDPNVPL
jgi:hypothetical protein